MEGWIWNFIGIGNTGVGEIQQCKTRFKYWRQLIDQDLVTRVSSSH